MVAAGRSGAISGDKWLAANYDPDKLRLLLPYLRFDNPRVRAETVLLLTSVRERGAMAEIRRMSIEEGDLVSMACLGYLTAMGEDDDAIPGLLDVMDHTSGSEFVKAARRLACIARAEDVPHVRRIYGQVNGAMRDETRNVLERIIARNPDLESKRELILSVPVYPDEAAFERFLDSSIEYLDVRYRRNVLPRSDVSLKTFNNVARALRDMRIRLYNEADNMTYYDPEMRDRYHELTQLVLWANDDLARKRVVRPAAEGSSRVCPRCGGMMVSYKGMWSCPECGGGRRGRAVACFVRC